MSPLAALRDAMQRHKADPLPAEAGDYRFALEVAYNAILPLKPASVSWRVAPNPQSTTTPPTRPMWLPDGSKQVAERATVGQPCDCSKPLVKGTQTLCPLASKPAGNVTACVK